MKIDLLKLDISKIDLTKIDIKRFKNLQAISIAALIVIFIFDLLLLLPLTARMQEASRQYTQDAQEVGHATKLLLKEGSLGKAPLFALESIDDLYDKIIELAKRHQVEIVLNNSLGTAKNKDTFYWRKILRVEITGTLKNAGAFLKAMHELPEAILEIDNANITRNPKDASLITIKTAFILFSLPNEENV